MKFFYYDSGTAVVHVSTQPREGLGDFIGSIDYGDDPAPNNVFVAQALLRNKGIHLTGLVVHELPTE